ncbi:MAG TPA: pyrroline-5-carboxylate reductase dimerization domain-containing protein [Terriglobales bacterium]|nr:pyrroline-5-carboxylate reductase dimerization domain-containing protein [Terriglobales bacterium]
MHAGFIGIGSMGGMLVRALLRCRALAPEEIWAANRSSAKLDALGGDFPGVHVASPKQLAAECDLIFLCVGSADTATVLAQMDAELYPGQLLITTAGVIPLRALEDRVPCRVAKLIPSITQEIGAGIALLIYGSRVTAEDRDLLQGLLGRICRPEVISESLARPAIGLCSGGPALLAYLLESMADQAVRSNPELSPELARKLVQEAATATMRLLREANMTTQEIVRRVAVPGGMTAHAIQILSRHVPQAWQAIFRETADREAQARESLVL